MDHSVRLDGGLDGEPDGGVRCDACKQRPATRRQANRTICWWCFVRSRPVVQRSLTTAIVVGTVLAVINQSGALLADGVTASVGARIGLTYVVPYLVATWGALGASRVTLTTSAAVDEEH